MALSNVLWKVISAAFPFSDFVYILQLEEYSSRRFLKWLPRFFFRRNFQVRQKVEWTGRATIVCVTAVVLWFAFTVTVWLVVGALALLSLPLIPLFVLAANGVLVIPFALMHARVRRRAAARLAAFKERGKIVVIAGSFGKTTTKHFLEQLTRYNYRVQMTPGNLNTPAGIAAWVLNDIKPGTNLLLIEADGYSKREYQETGEMVRADIVVITNVGDQHLERFGSRAALADALGEVVTLAQKDSEIICTRETRDDLPEHVFKEKSVHVVAPETNDSLSESNAANLALAHETAKTLNIPEAIIVDTISKLELPDRRQKPAKVYGYDAIDDSYNISWTTAQAGIAAAKEAAREASKKLVVVTAGVVELGPDDQDKNIRLGELLAKEADHTIVLPSMFASDILKGLGSAPRTAEKRRNDAMTEILAPFNPKKWFLLVQPGLPDLYY